MPTDTVGNDRQKEIPQSSADDVKTAVSEAGSNVGAPRLRAGGFELEASRQGAELAIVVAH